MESFATKEMDRAADIPQPVCSASTAPGNKTLFRQTVVEHHDPSETEIEFDIVYSR